MLDAFSLYERMLINKNLIRCSIWESWSIVYLSGVSGVSGAIHFLHKGIREIRRGVIFCDLKDLNYSFQQIEIFSLFLVNWTFHDIFGFSGNLHTWTFNNTKIFTNSIIQAKIIKLLWIFQTAIKLFILVCVLQMHGN